MEVSDAFLETLKQTNPSFKNAVITGIEKRGEWTVQTLTGIGPAGSGCAAIVSSRNANKQNRPTMPNDGKAFLVTAGRASVGLIEADSENELTNKISYSLGV